MVIAESLVILGIVFWLLGRSGLQRQGKPKFKKGYSPKVSIVIPSHSNEKTILRCVESAKKIDYPRKEIVVVDDSKKDPSRLCRSLGVKCFHSKTRMGKPGALNFGIHRTSGELLFLLDVDTVVPRDILQKTVPWFLDKDVAGVMPRFTAKGKKGVTRLVEIENRLTLALVKMTLFFGSSVGYRGCCVLLRKSIVNKLGGIPDTLTEDNDFSAKIVHAGHRIIYEPGVTVTTGEPETIEALRRQKTRWGKGALFSFLHHRHFYTKNTAFILYFIPYLIIGIALLLTSLWSLFTNLFYFGYLLASVLVAGIIHIYIMLLDDKKPSLLDTIRFLVVYIPLTNYSYLRGVIQGIKVKKQGREELDTKNW
jgi:cellulose synthase/poly-beta-1,6-N-acetylglucosamine synthase-like glycosyltransferase